MSGFGFSKSPRSSSSSVSVNVSPFNSKRAPPPRPSTPSISRSNASSPSTPPSSSDCSDFSKLKENVTVTVRFRPLSAREINKGDEIAWYADGDFTVRNEYNSAIAYGFDRVFGPATTTRHVYDVAAQHVVRGSMEGINGTVFAYGVTSSGKTHTMHGEQKSPGIIPLAVKDVFGIIQETPGREFLLRVSYLEIYNEVINDLLDPTGQNLRIREDSQGTYVEGIKEEVVLSPAHALSLIASGEEHRHVGSNNFNLLSSRSHTIFTLTIESSPCDETEGEENIILSQLNLIDLAGSESSKTETTGLRRKEGSYINKSLLTLGTVIAKLTDGKCAHIPYRDSKLTRLLQSSLSGHGRVSLICTVTPASSNSEETHNTLKFAHRSKNVEIKAAQNKIMDEKSLIKKYQREISNLKQELQQLKRGMMEKSYVVPSNQEDLFNLKLKLEAGQVKLQSRLEEEEQEKAALMGRIQRLTKLILVSSKNSLYSSAPTKGGHLRRHSFGEDELAYLPDRKREYMIDDDIGSLDSELSEVMSDAGILDDPVKDDKRNKRRGMLGWFKMRKPELVIGRPSGVDNESSASGSPASGSQASKLKDLDTTERRKSVSRRANGPPTIDSFPGRTQAGDLFSATVRGCPLPPTENTITDQMDLLREQVKMMAGEIALCTSTLKRFSEQAAKNPDDLQLQENRQKLMDEINEKKLQMQLLEQRMIGSIEATPHTSSSIDMSQALSKLTSQLNEVTFELEIKSADNRILQEQLKMKISENAKMQETIHNLKQQFNSLLDKCSNRVKQMVGEEDEILGNYFLEESGEKSGWAVGNFLPESTHSEGNSPANVMSLASGITREDSKGCTTDVSLNSQVLMQAAEIENLKQEKVRLIEEKDGLEIHSQKLAEEASYAKELAAAAAVELRNLAEEVTKLSYQNEKLTNDLAAVKEQIRCRASCCHRQHSADRKQDPSIVARSDGLRNLEHEILIDDLQRELGARCQREASLELALSEKDRIEGELQKRIDEAKRREQDLENELANMWVLVAKLRKSGVVSEETSPLKEHGSDTFQIENGFCSSNGNTNNMFKEYCSDQTMENLGIMEDIRANHENERKRSKELEVMISRLKGEDVKGLDINALDELQGLHVEAVSNISQAKYSRNPVSSCTISGSR